jgi:hypothetical protein
MKNIIKSIPLMFACCVVSAPSYADLLANNRFQKELHGEPAPDAPKLLPNSEKSLGSPVNSEGNPVKEFFDDPSNGMNSGSKSAAGKNSDSSSGGLKSGNDGSNGASSWGHGSKVNPDGSAVQSSGNGTGAGSKYVDDGTNGASMWGHGSKVNPDGSAVQSSDDSQYNKDFPPLTEADKKMIPNASPPGMPSMPSKCAEDKNCKPCYVEANVAINKQRMNLEKVSAIYRYTHRFTSEGLDMMNGVAATAGGPAQMGAAVETQKVNGALDEFDKSVRSKNIELLDKLQEGLKQMSVCESKYFKNDDWYMRYGEVYYQFMQARYSN